MEHSTLFGSIGGALVGMAGGYFLRGYLEKREAEAAAAQQATQQQHGAIIGGIPMIGAGTNTGTTQTTQLTAPAGAMPQLPPGDLWYFQNPQQKAVSDARVAMGLPAIPQQPTIGNSFSHGAVSQPGTNVRVETIEGATAVAANDGGYSLALQPYAEDLARRVLAQPNFWRPSNSVPNSRQLKINAVLAYVVGRWPQLASVVHGQPITRLNNIGIDGPAWAVVLRSGNVQLGQLDYSALYGWNTPLKSYTAQQNLVALINTAASYI